MRLNVVIAILLIVMGIAAFAYQGITYTTTGESFELQPILAALALIGGTTLLIVERKRFAHAAA